MVGDHGGGVAVERDARVVERLLGVAQAEVQLSHAALEYTPEVARNQCPPDHCQQQTHRVKHSLMASRLTGSHPV